LLRLNRLNGWRRGSKLPGRPDFIYPKHKLAVFVDGCFWHGCNTCFKLPATNREYWLAKIRNNKARDKRVTREISKVGWESLRIWEHQLEKRPNWVLRKIREKLSN
jgi:DNA mismatch endonuclease (patch repair protein)